MNTNFTTPYIIGITGGSASGKTKFMQTLLSAFTPEEACQLSQDDYYKPINEIPRDDNGVENFDLPETINYSLFAEHIKKLRNGETVEHREYTFNNREAIPKKLSFHPTPIIIVEGLFIFYYPEISELIDLKIFVDAKEHFKIKRRILRDNNERGYDLNDVLYRWEHHISPTYEKFIKPLRDEADIVVNNNINFDKGVEVIMEFLKGKIKRDKSSNC